MEAQGGREEGAAVYGKGGRVSGGDQCPCHAEGGGLDVELLARAMVPEFDELSDARRTYWLHRASDTSARYRALLAEKGGGTGR